MRQIKKKLALFMAVALLFGCMPLKAQAAAQPKFKKTYTVFYENRSNKGIYDITLKNVKKGYILKWHITGKGKKYASFDSVKTFAKGTTATNTLKIDSKGEQAFAAGERIRITVNVYTSKWKLVSKPTFAGKLQCKAKSIDIDTSAVDNLQGLAAGKPYEFHANMTPANATSKVYWQVTDSTGADHSKEITDAGVWTPVKDGSYTITALAKNSPTGQPLCKKEVKATVRSVMDNVTQTAANGIYVTFLSQDAVNYKEADFQIKSGESSIPVKKVKYSNDRKTAYLTTGANFADGKTYTVSCAGESKTFTASVGKPAALSITTTSAQIQKYTTISYVLLDANGIDVTNTINGVSGMMHYSADVSNGFLDPQTNRLYMTVLGSTATVKLTYLAPEGIQLNDTKVIQCVPQQAVEAATTNFTLTNNEQEPAYSSADVRSIAVGDTMYAHFRALDDNDAVIAYDSITYVSSDPDKLIISANGKITPIKTGTVTVVVNARQGSFPLQYTYPVTVTDGRYLAALQMKETSVSMSNTYTSEYQKEITVKATDQYGANYALTNETAVIRETSGKRVLASYDASTNMVLIRAQGAPVGTYNYVLTLTQGGKSISQNFTVVVSAPVPNGAVNYVAEASEDTLDLSVDANTVGNRSLTIRLSEYRGGVFYGYKTFLDATIRKGNVYYGSDLVTYSTAGAITTNSSNVLTLTPLTIVPATDGSRIGTCKKAEPGVYTVTLSYWDTGYRVRTENVNITITDGQNPPEYTIRSLTTSRTVSNALELVNECLYFPNGTIINCSAVGTNLVGNAISLRSGEQIHISTITVRSVVTIASGQSVYVNHVVPIGRTFTNY